MVRNLKLLFTLLVFSITTVVGTESTLPLGQAYHAGQVNPFVHKVLHGGIGAGTAAISGGNIWAGAAGAVAGEIAGEVYLGTQTPTLQNTNHLTRQAANIGRVAGGLAGLVAGGDPNTGANTGTIAAENNAVQFIPFAIAAGSVAYTAWQGDGNPLKGLEKIGSGDDPLSQAVSSGVEQSVELSAQHFPEATQRVVQVLSKVGNAVDASVTYVDQATGQTVSRTWNSLDASTQNMLRGAGKVLGVGLTAAQVGKISSIAKGTQAGKAHGPRLLPKPEEIKLLAPSPVEFKLPNGTTIKGIPANPSLAPQAPTLRYELTPDQAAQYLRSVGLPETQIDSFVSSFKGPIYVRNALPGETFGAYSGGPNNPASGQFLTPGIAGQTPGQASNILALPPSNPATHLNAATINQRIPVLEGMVAPQNWNGIQTGEGWQVLVPGGARYGTNPPVTIGPNLK